MYQKTLEIWHEMLEKGDPSRIPEEMQWVDLE